jgi:uncharacterized protein (TIGR02996 family)
MTGEEEAFLRAICANPDDDLPRLVYADWLDERGDPRGEFIRVECELPHLASEDPRRRQLHLRDCELIRLHKERWVGMIPELVRRHLAGYWDFRRGLLEVLAIDAAALVGEAAAYVRCMPISQLTVYNLSADAARGLANSPVLARVLNLALSAGRGYYSSQSHPAVSPEAVLSVLQATSPARLSSLRLCAGIGDSGAAALCKWSGLETLSRLELPGNQIGNAGARALADAPALGRVAHIDLSENPITATGVRRLRERFGDRVRYSDPDTHLRRRRSNRPRTTLPPPSSPPP